MSDRKFYKTVLTLEVLSEDAPVENMDLDSILYEINEGHCSGMVCNVTTEVLTAPQAAQCLMEQGSDPEFFRLSHDGRELED